MRRKLISYDAFDQIEKGSLTNAVNELVKAEETVAEMLELDSVSLHCYDEQNVYYETSEGNFIHAVYELGNKHIKLENIEEVAIDTDSADKARKAVVATMIEALIQEPVDHARAKQCFRQIAEMRLPKFKFGKGRKGKGAIAKRLSNNKGNMAHMNEGSDLSVTQKSATPDPKKRIAAIKGHRSHPSASQKAITSRRRTKHISDALHRSGKWKSAKKRAEVAATTSNRARIKGQRITPNKMNEWLMLSENIFNYVDKVASGPIRESVSVKRDNSGNVISAILPNSVLRNEGKLLSLKWDTLKTDVKVMRDKAMKLHLEESFQNIVSHIKRLNNLSNNAELQEALNQLVGNYPNVLYLTQNELTQSVSEALHTVGASNYDDQVCSFIAEGILRVAFDSYPERVSKLASLSNAKRPGEGDDAFEIFQSAVEDFFPYVDEQMTVEMTVVKDLHSSLLEVRKAALDANCDVVRSDATSYISKLEDMLNGVTRPDLETVEEAAGYLAVVAETNLSTQNWDVVKTPYRTTVGEHPDMAKKAGHSYAPSRDLATDAWGTAAVSDGKNLNGEDGMRNKAWGNIGGNDTYPAVSNPYVPKGGDYTMSYEPGVDKNSDSGLGQNSGGDTWPNLSNPYVPKSVKKHVNDDNKLDDVESRVGLNQSSDLNQSVN